VIATEIAQRYQAGAGMRTLTKEYHMGPCALRRILLEMGVTIRPPGHDSQAWERPQQVKEEILARYQAGGSLTVLISKYHIGQHTLRRLLVSMGATIRPVGVRVHQVSREEVRALQHKARERRMASGEYCRRCEILLRYDPGQDGYCGECWEEVSHAVVSQNPLHGRYPGLPDTAADGEGI